MGAQCGTILLIWWRCTWIRFKLWRLRLSHWRQTSRKRNIIWGQRYGQQLMHWSRVRRHWWRVRRRTTRWRGRGTRWESQSMPGTPVSSGTPPLTFRVNIRGRVRHVVGSPWHFHSSSDNRTWPTAHQAQHGPFRPLCCSAIPRMCNRRAIPWVGTEYQLGWVPRQMLLTSEAPGVHH